MAVPALTSLKAEKAWPKPAGNAFYATHNERESAFDFLAAARCFLHYRNRRDDNILDWHAQDEAAAQSIGLETLGIGRSGLLDAHLLSPCAHHLSPGVAADR